MRVMTLLLLVFAMACAKEPQSRSFPLAGPSPVQVQQPQQSAPSTPSIPVSNVTLGDPVQGVIGDGRTINPGEQGFLITVPRSGILTATLTWDPSLRGHVIKAHGGREGGPASTAELVARGRPSAS